jgi:5-methylcytosine-specific restriction enzyme A
MGQVPWWTPPARPNREVGRFLAQVTALIDGWSAEPEEPGIMVEKRLYRLHRKQERNHAAALLAKQHHGFRCQACAFEFRETYGPLGDGFIEAHHLRPLASLKEGTSGVYDVAKDFAVLCSNCHRMIHRTQDPSDLRGFRALLAQQKLMPRGG